MAEKAEPITPDESLVAAMVGSCELTTSQITVAAGLRAHRVRRAIKGLVAAGVLRERREPPNRLYYRKERDAAP